MVKIASIINNFENKMNLLLLKCKNDINQINEMYKYNKNIMSKNEETQLINYLIKPFIEFIFNELEKLKEKINILTLPVKEELKDENVNKAIVKYENKFDINKNNEYEYQLSNNLQDIFEKNNFYSMNEIIIKNHCINLDKEFE